MQAVKVVISVPYRIFKAGEHLSKQMGISRNQLYEDALSSYLSARAAAAVTAKLNAVHSPDPGKLDPAFTAAQTSILADEAW